MSGIRMPASDAIVVTATAVRTAAGDSRREILRRASAGAAALATSPALEGGSDRRVVGAVEGERTGAELPDVRNAGAAPAGAEDVDARTFACRGGPIGADRAEALLAATLADALREAKLDPATLNAASPPRRIRLVLGTTLNGMRHLGPYLRGGPARDAALLTASSVASIACERCGLPAAGITISSACASGISTIGIACDLLRAGDADIVIAGGYDPVSEFSHAGFGALRLLAGGAPRPFAADREGMRTAEGYALLVLERAGDAVRRGAQALARVAAVAESSDAYHLTQPHPEGEGAAAAVLEAISLGGAPDVLVAHATGTEANDAAEYRAYARAFGPALSTLPVVTPKAAFGHTLGAAGAVDAALCIAMAESQSLMACAREDAPIDRAAFPALSVVDSPTSLRIRRTMNMALGFGGSNAALVLDHDLTSGRGDEEAAHPAAPASTPARREPTGADTDADPLVVTGWSAIVPGAACAGDAIASLRDIRPGDVTDEELAPFLDSRTARRIASVSRLVRAAVRLAVDDAKLDPALVTQAAACCASQHGALGYSMAAYREVVAGGLGAGNPLLFAESVPNVPGAQCPLAFGVRGAAITVIGSRVGFVEALLIARARLRSRRTDRVILIGADERDDDLDAVLVAWKQAHRGRPETAAGAVALVLEREGDARRRGAAIRAKLGTIAWAAPRARRPQALLDAAERAASQLTGTIDTPGRPGLLGRLERRAAGRRMGHSLGAELNAVGPALLAVMRAARGERSAVLALDPFGQAGGFELLPANEAPASGPTATAATVDVEPRDPHAPRGSLASPESPASSDAARSPRPFTADGSLADLPPPFRSLRGGEPRTSGEGTIVRTALDGSWALATTTVPRAILFDDDRFREAGERAVERTIAALRTAAPHPIARMWSFIPGINDPSAHGDRYRTFNVGRADAFARCATSGGELPAASGVGHAGDAIVIHALSLRGDARALENPRQIPAWRYSSRYGPRPPMFSRATAVRHDGAVAFFASGTASVIGETSAHPEDFRAQLEETWQNLIALCRAAADTLGAGAPADPVALLRSLRIHVRPGDVTWLPFVHDAIRTRLPDAEIELVVAPLCRPELAVEIEGCAWSPAP